MKQDLKQTYNAIAQEYAQIHSTRNTTVAESLEYVVARLPEKANVLELGCGPGRELAYFAERDYQVTGVDFSQAMLDIAKQCVPQAKLILGDIENFVLEKKVYDLIAAYASLLHIKKAVLPSVLEKMSLALKPKGYLHLSLKLGEGEGLVTSKKEHLTLTRFFAYYTEEEIETILVKKNFQVQDKRFYSSRTSGDQFIIIVAQTI